MSVVAINGAIRQLMGDLSRRVHSGKWAAMIQLTNQRRPKKGAR